MNALLLLAALASAAVTAVRPATLHPLLLGSFGDPRSPVTLQARGHAAALAPLPLSQAGAVLQARALESPAAAVAARAVAAAIADPAKAEALKAAAPELAAALPAAPQGEPLPDTLSRLAAEAEKDPEVRRLFDSRAAKPGLELEGLSYGRKGLTHEGRGVEHIGRGDFGVVDAHPKMEGAVIKTVAPSAEAMLFSMPDPKAVADKEEATARRLEQAGVGPRYLGRAVLDGRLVSVRERVYGRDVQRLIADRKFGRKAERLILDMLRRMAEAGVKTDDMHPRNIMIGRTAADPERKAYLVDGGNLLKPDSGDKPTFEELHGQQTTLLVKLDPYVGEVVFSRPFKQLLEEGIARSRQRTWWQRFKGVLKEMASMPVTPGIR